MHDLGCVGFKGFMSFATEAYPRISDGYLVEGMRTAASFGGLIALHAENAEVADFGCKYYSRIHCNDEACFDEARPWWTEYDAIQRAVLFAKMTGPDWKSVILQSARAWNLCKMQRKKGSLFILRHVPITLYSTGMC